MNKFRFTIKVLAIAIFMFAFASIAQAQATRTWVSGVGDDANPCSRTAPCKTFAGAISKTAACGEIDALDPGGFGAVTITKAITIDGTGTLAGILAAGTTGVIINVGLATDVVTLRGLSINGACTGIDGVRIVGIQPKAVNIEDCVIFRFTNNGVNWATTSVGTGTGPGHLNIRNSVLRNNTLDGVVAGTTAGQVKGVVYNSSMIGNGNGFHAKANSRMAADQSNFSDNTGNGVLADGSVAVIRVSNSSISNNGTNGVNGGSGGIVSINSCDIYNNVGSGALVSGGGEVDTYGNNRIFANGTDGCVSCSAKGVS
jgi:hypothetical protein